MKAGIRLIALLVSMASACIFADDAQWEVGAGIGTISIPHYPGSDESLELILPVPYRSYKDDRTKIDRNGLNYDLLGIDDLDLSFSAGFGLPIKSDDNKAREGMTDLDPVLEIGPALKYWLFNDPTNQLSIELPIRTALAFNDTSMRQQGFTGDLKLNYSHQYQGWKFNTFYRILYADKKYHQQYYQVEQQYVTPDRSFYLAKKGFSGDAIGVSISKRFGEFYIGIYTRYENLSNAVNKDSPLIKSTDNLYFSAVFSWVFASSEYQ